RLLRGTHAARTTAHGIGRLRPVEQTDRSQARYQRDHGEGPPGPGYAEDASRFPRRTGESRRSTRPAAGRAPLIPAYRPTPSCNRSWSRTRVSLTASSWSPMYTSDKGSGAAAMPANTGDGVRRTRRANGTLVTARRLVSGCRVVSESRGNPLGLLALAGGLASAELAGGFALPVVMPLVNRIEQSFVRRVESLSAPT